MNFGEKTLKDSDKETSNKTNLKNGQYQSVNQNLELNKSNYSQNSHSQLLNE